MRSGVLRRAGLVLLLLLPAVLFYWAHFRPKDPRLIPTGFVQYDQPYYMANARQYLDGRSDGWRYALPFSPSAAATPAHFQPQTMLLAGLWRITGADPGKLFVAFGAAAAIVFLLLSARLLDQVLERTAPVLLTVVFVWGGGLLALAGFSISMLQDMDWRMAALSAFRFDPGDGWWFLNLGRNLIFPMEAYYHALFFGAVLLLYRNRPWLSALVAAVLALSHPFTGSAALLVLLAWGTLELIVHRDRIVSAPWVAFVAALLMALMVWHGYILPQDAEHQSLMQQWKLPWLIELQAWLPAYAIVASMTAWRLRSCARIKAFFSLPMNRLLAVWAMVFLALENHELVMEPLQPAHFTRGYSWAALFLIGAPALLEFAQDPMKRLARGAVAAVFVCVMLLDNAGWFALRIAESRNGAGEGIWLSEDQLELYHWLEHQLPNEEMLITEDPQLAYLAMTYTHHRAWYSHWANTPFADRQLKEQRAYFSGDLAAAGLHHGHIAITRSGSVYSHQDSAERIFSNGSFAAYLYAGNQ